MTSPLTPEERADVRRQFADESIVRLLDELDERDALERRAQAAESERDEARARLEQARAAVDAWWPTVYYPPTAVERAVRAALAPGGGA